MSHPTLLVLAAGMGSRYGGLKQIDPMGPAGETILDYSVYDAIQAGFGKVVFVIRRDFEKAFRESIGDRFADRIAVEYAFQALDDLPEGFTVSPGRKKPWGTAHAIRAARHAVTEPFAVINADDFYGRDAYQQAGEFLSGATSAAESCLVGYYLKNTLSDHGGVNRGVTSQVNGLLAEVEEIFEIQREEEGGIAGRTLDGETRNLNAHTIVSMNFWGFTPAFFTQLEAEFVSFLESEHDAEKAECYIPTVVDHLVSRGETRCRVLPTTGSWFGVTYPDDKPIVAASLATLAEEGIYPPGLNA